ncbi:hypothetical protein H2199_001549 [Coniosporium tulheliwenetii]|uniref:Uncharacterized protein n=1 Tax=Coniosporium tulheliwenetii TaxID=3383036 RepID=A0ACC2ZJL8_9PEZI|nr:hypothetical protein H2199_001549 [Cladosporium sp. JES 115]
MASPTQNSPFLKQLTSSDRRKRDQAVDSLRTYLSGRTTFEEIELLKLWKGLFYCMWMQDKPRNQQRLAIDLAGLVDIVTEDMFVPFLDAFWKTMAREWKGIDALRMDKFLFLIRQYLAASFRQLAKQQWRDTDRIEQYMDVLRATPLNARDHKIPNGLRYHVIDIYVDELDKVDADRDGHMPLEQLLRPLMALRKESPTKAVRTRVKEALEGDERLRDWNGKGDDKGVESERSNGPEAARDGAHEDGDEEWGGIDE